MTSSARRVRVPRRSALFSSRGWPAGSSCAQHSSAGPRCPSASPRRRGSCPRMWCRPPTAFRPCARTFSTSNSPDREEIDVDVRPRNGCRSPSTPSVSALKRSRSLATARALAEVSLRCTTSDRDVPFCARVGHGSPYAVDCILRPYPGDAGGHLLQRLRDRRRNGDACS